MSISPLNLSPYNSTCMDLAYTFYLNRPFFVFRSWIPTAQGPSGIPRSYRQQGQTGPFHLQSACGRAQFNFQGKANKFQCDLEIDFFFLQTLLKLFFLLSHVCTQRLSLYNCSFFESYITICMCCLKSSILHEIAWFYVDGFSYWVAQIDRSRQIQCSPHTQWG